MVRVWALVVINRIKAEMMNLVAMHVEFGILAVLFSRVVLCSCCRVFLLSSDVLSI